MEPLAGATLGLPVVLAGGAAVVLGTAAALSVRAAARPELPSARWIRPLPPAASAVIDRAVSPAALRATGLLVVAILLGTLVTTDRPVRGGALVAAVVLVSLVLGPLLWPRDPVDGGTPDAGGAGPAVVEVGWPAVSWLAAISLLLVTVDDGAVLAACLAGYGLVQVASARRWGATGNVRRDALVALSVVVGRIAPLDRLRDGRLAWRNPLVSAAHAQPRPATLWLTAVVVALALAGSSAATADRTLTPLGVAAQFVLIAVVAGVVLRVGMIRPFFLGALAPLTAAYGLQAGGRWLAPIDLMVFVALHATAVAVLHRQAIARHDPRTARAVQFPPRLVVVASVLAGLAVFSAA